jgi:hypothetical protein
MSLFGWSNASSKATKKSPTDLLAAKARTRIGNKVQPAPIPLEVGLALTLCIIQPLTLIVIQTVQQSSQIGQLFGWNKIERTNNGLKKRARQVGLFASHIASGGSIMAGCDVVGPHGRSCCLVVHRVASLEHFFLLRSSMVVSASSMPSLVVEGARDVTWLNGLSNHFTAGVGGLDGPVSRARGSSGGSAMRAERVFYW